MKKIKNVEERWAKELPHDKRSYKLAKRLAAIGKTLFSSKEGLELLNFFKSQTLDRPVFNSGVEAGKQATHAAYREGQNNIIRQLVDFTKAKKDEKQA